MKLESNFSRLFKVVVTPDEKKTRNNLYVFLVCLGISILIWFLIALSKESYTSLEYPIEFTNVPSDMVLVNKPDSILIFRISSSGFELFTLKYFSRKEPVTIDLEGVKLEKQNGYYSGTLNTSILSSEISGQYNFAEELISIAPDKLYFKFEILIGKMVPVVSNLKLEFEKQFRLSDSIIFSPAEVKIIGPGNLIDKIDFIATDATLIQGIEGLVNSSCNLEKPFTNEQLEIIPDRVDFALSAERFTESTLSIPIISGDKKVMVKTFPENVTVTFLVSLSNFNRIYPDLFTAVIDLPEQTEDKLKAIVRLTKKPAFVEVTKIEPGEVDFLVLKQ